MREDRRTILNVSGVIPYELCREIEQDHGITPDIISQKNSYFQIISYPEFSW